MFLSALISELRYVTVGDGNTPSSCILLKKIIIIIQLHHLFVHFKPNVKTALQYLHLYIFKTNTWSGELIKQLFNGHLFEFNAVPSVQDGTSSPLGCGSSGCSCCHRSLVSHCWDQQGRTHLGMMKLEKKRTKSRESRWQTCQPLRILSFFFPSRFLSHHVGSLWIPILLRNFLPPSLPSVCVPSFPFIFFFVFVLLPFSVLQPMLPYHSSFFFFPLPPFLHFTTSTFSWRGLLCSAECMVIICSYTLIWLCVQTCTWPAKCFVEKKSRQSELFLAGLVLFLWALW